MVSLRESHPAVYAECLKGNFAVKKSRRALSAITINQAHEQKNSCVKGDGGAVGLTENPAALHCWMVSGPEMDRVIEEFDGSIQKKQDMNYYHHEQNKHAQMAFARDMKSLSAQCQYLMPSRGIISIFSAGLQSERSPANSSSCHS